jgi:hypothetical protein
MMKKLIFSTATFIIGTVFILTLEVDSQQKPAERWKFQSIDTMKYSRDVAREKLSDASFDRVIDQQVKNIASTGATHVAIATPYDEEFYPFLKRWVDSARRNNLNVWFRGNWSGWEGWFEYPDITREEHINKTREFIISKRDLFKDGDIFSACPECENGGPGDPRSNGDLIGHRQFLVNEYKVTKAAFRRINKKVASNYLSMNGDVARLVMDKNTTKSLDGIVAVDHYVSTPEKLAEDVKEFARLSGGKVVLGEMGAPIPDIHGDMTEEQQAEWIKKALGMLIEMPEVEGINYWTNTGSSTELWDGDGNPKLAVGELTAIFNAPVVKVVVKDETGRNIRNTYLTLEGNKYKADRNGFYFLPFIEGYDDIEVKAQGYITSTAKLVNEVEMQIVLKKEKEDAVFKFRKIFRFPTITRPQ